MRPRRLLAREPGDRPANTSGNAAAGGIRAYRPASGLFRRFPRSAVACGGHAKRGRITMSSSYRWAPLALSLFPAVAHSQSDVTPLSDIPSGDEVVVTATRFEQPVHEIPVGMIVITDEQIAASGVRTLPQLLARHPGITVRDNSGNPDQSVDLRGFGITGDQNTLVLV